MYVWANVTLDAYPGILHSESQVEDWREPIGELEDRVRLLEAANREYRRIIGALTQRTPELEAPHGQEEVLQEPSGGPQSVMEILLSRPWWRRVLGA